MLWFAWWAAVWYLAILPIAQFALSSILCISFCLPSASPSIIYLTFTDRTATTKMSSMSEIHNPRLAWVVTVAAAAFAYFGLGAASAHSAKKKQKASKWTQDTTRRGAMGK
ncbi:hypothetical protein DOTSEDRAFT_73207 [Dothistroma septosporum NZE10]|uniref:Uncharacterized protein n=1 Tax=Dothistroma septosporum (strain NZE10 / CBS 128990) TaxID=675120 RepID=N1PIT9_DOTSN|nr:hypothetical protein DOTSEDRAFT_73207 [Dothistroma septosporum NZE10]